MVDVWMFVADKVQKDFDEFDHKEEIGLYIRNKHIQMTTQIVVNCLDCGDYPSMQDIDDLIHGLNHIFFIGVAAGQALEWRKEK